MAEATRDGETSISYKTEYFGRLLHLITQQVLSATGLEKI